MTGEAVVRENRTDVAAKLTGRAPALALVCAGLEPSLPLVAGSSARARPIVTIETPVKHNVVNRSREAIRFPLICCRGSCSNRKTVVRSSYRNDKDNGLPAGSIARICFGVMNAETSRGAAWKLQGFMTG